MASNRKRTRRNEDQIIADLESKIAALKARAQRKKDPALKHVTAAMRSIDKALEATDDTATRQALNEARATLSAVLSLEGTLVPRTVSKVDAAALLAHIRAHPGQRAEQIAAALGTDSKSMRPVMRGLIEDRKVKTSGEKRGMTYLVG
jgi:hypothetical protein